MSEQANKYIFWTLCKSDDEGAQKLESEIYGEPPIYVAQKEYSSEQNDFLQRQLKKYVLTEVQIYDSDTFHGPFADTTHRHNEQEKEIEIPSEAIIVRNRWFQFYGCVVDYQWKSLHNREGDREGSCRRYLLPDGKLTKLYSLSETEVYGSDGEESTYEEDKYWRLEDREE